MIEVRTSRPGINYSGVTPNVLNLMNPYASPLDIITGCAEVETHEASNTVGPAGRCHI